MGNGKSDAKKEVLSIRFSNGCMWMSYPVYVNMSLFVSPVKTFFCRDFFLLPRSCRSKPSPGPTYMYIYIYYIHIDFQKQNKYKTKLYI